MNYGYGHQGSARPPCSSQNQSGLPYSSQGPPTGIVGGMPMPFSPYSNQSTPYPPQPGAFAGQSSASHPGQSAPSQPAPYPSYPGYNSGHSAPYSSQPAPYSNQHAPYPSQPAPYSSQPAPYPSQPAPYSSQPAPYSNQPDASYSSQAAYNPHCSVPNQPAHNPGYSASSHPGHQAGPYPSHSYGNSSVASSASCYPIGNPSLSHASTQIIVTKFTPTVPHNPNFNAVNDAQVLRKAMKGLGTDEKAIINVLANRNNEHRQKIAQQFQAQYGKNLIANLKSELSGRFEDLILAMMTPIAEFYAQEIHSAISGIGTNENCLIQCLCPLKNQDIRTICKIYNEKYHRTLERDICGDTSGYFQRILVALCAGGRDESTHIDVSAAKSDAMKLYEAGAGRWGTNEMAFISILAQRNVYQLKTIFQEYKNIHGHTIYDAIKREFSGDIANALGSIIKCVTNSAEYFAEQLFESMSGIGTKDRELIRLVVTRSEVDMGDIKQAFVKLYGKTLENRIDEDTSGDYRKCLIALIS